MRVTAIIESRMSSTRLPGKNLKPILGRPMVARLIERLKLCRRVDVICLATSTDPGDGVLEEVALAEGIACHRGSLEDVLERTLGAARAVEAELIVEITGDCPLCDPAIVDAAIARYGRGDCDYVANVLDRLTFPAGFDVQLYSTALLAEVDRLADDPYDRNNVTPFIYHNPDRYRLLNLFAPPELDRPRYWLCADHLADFELITAIFEAHYPAHPGFGAREIIAWLDAHPQWAAHNFRADNAFEFPSAFGRARQEMLQFEA